MLLIAGEVCKCWSLLIYCSLRIFPFISLSLKTVPEEVHSIWQDFFHLISGWFTKAFVEFISLKDS